MTNPIELSIIKGIAPIPGDTLSAEQQIETISLLGTNGITLVPDGWTPRIASYKRGGTFIDSPTMDNAELVAIANDKVSETFNCTITQQTDAACYTIFKALKRIADDAAEFHTEFSQVQPVYLKWFANGANYPQYALIYTLEFTYDRRRNQKAGVTSYDVTVTIIREAAWRLIAPGANPKLATFIIRGETTVHKAVGDYSLVSSTYQFKQQTIQNRREWNSTQTAELSKNYIDIPASDIPGDAPALVELHLIQSSVGAISMTDAVIGLRSGRTSFVDRGGNTRNPFYTLNVGDAGALTSTTIANDTGAPISDSSNTQGKRSETNAASGSLSWNGSTETGLDLNIMRGEYLAFVRARTSADPTTFAISLSANVGGGLVTTTPVSLSGAGGGGTGNTTSWFHLYLGTVVLPPSGDSMSLLSGLGSAITVKGSSSSNLTLTLNFTRSSGSGILYVADLILIPIDEGAVLTSSSGFSTTTGLILDNTGYFNRTVQDFAAMVDSSNDGRFAMATLQGNIMRLQPGVNNRLYFYQFNSVLSAPLSTLTDPMIVRMNIVPCWWGPCDL